MLFVLELFDLPSYVACLFFSILNSSRLIADLSSGLHKAYETES